MPKALIIGCGIAGPAAAMALQRAGYEPTIYDAYDRESRANAGAYQTIAVNGIDALRAIDAAHLLTGHGFPAETIEFFSGSGRRLGALQFGGVHPDGTVTHTIKRAEFARLLREEAIRRGVPVVHRKRLVEATTTASGEVIAFFEDGTRAVGDILIGADGVHSRARRLIDRHAPQPRYTGLGKIGGFTRHAYLDVEPGMYRMYFGRRAFFGFTVAGDGEIWWFANPPAEKELSYPELAALTTSRLKNKLIDLFEEDRSPAVEIILATDHELSLSNAYDLPSVPVWSSGAMIIIGDAAHAASPASGQGASMALEDAVELARCLRDLPDTAQAFTAYEDLRRARVERVVALGAQSSRYKTAGPIGRFARDLILPVVLRRKASSAPESAWLYNHHIDWESEVQPPQKIAV